MSGTVTALLALPSNISRPARVTEGGDIILASTRTAGCCVFPCLSRCDRRLELAIKTEREIANKLIAVCLEERRVRKSNDMLDISQHGGHYNWRNVLLNGRSWKFDEKHKLVKEGLPTAGVLDFDIVSTSCAHRIVSMPAVSDTDFQRLLTDLHGVRNTVLPPKEHEQEPAPEVEPELEACPETPAEIAVCRPC